MLIYSIVIDVSTRSRALRKRKMNSTHEIRGKSRSGLKCAVFGCMDYYSARHRFPVRYPDICDKWIKVLSANARVSTLPKEVVVRKFVVCHRHFSEDSKCPGTKRGLKANAVPSLFLPATCDDVQQLEPSNGNGIAEESPEFSSVEAAGDECVEEYLAASDYETAVSYNAEDEMQHPDLLFSASSVSFKGHFVKQLDLEEYTEDDPEEEITEGSVAEERNILENIRQELCRVCGNKDHSLISILDDTSTNDAYNVPLVKMLEMYFPLRIVADDMFPLSICDKCYNTLHTWHDLSVTCVAANKAFHSIFFRDKNKVEDEVENGPRNGVGDESELVPSSGENDHTYVKQQDGSEDIQDKKQNSLCEQCGVDLGVDSSDEISSEILNLMYTRNIRAYVCKYCFEFFKNKYELKDHFKLCEETSTICEKCGKVFQQRKHFEKHKARVHDCAIVMCEKCGISMRPHLLSNHIDSVHSQPHYCDLCCKILRSRFLYCSHMQQHSKGKIKSTFKIEPVFQDGCYVFICPVCNETFLDKSSIIIHLTELRDVKCPTCRVKLKNEKEFVLHSCKVWSCQYCGKNFYSKLLWKEHERIHTGEKPYKCRSCNFYFRTLHQRTLHHRTHLNRSCECKYCRKKFKHVSALHKHMACHEGVDHTCPVCSKTFPRRLSLELHVRRHLKKSTHQTSG